VSASLKRLEPCRTPAARRSRRRAGRANCGHPDIVVAFERRPSLRPTDPSHCLVWTPEPGPHESRQCEGTAASRASRRKPNDGDVIAKAVSKPLCGKVSTDSSHAVPACKHGVDGVFEIDAPWCQLKRSLGGVRSAVMAHGTSSANVAPSFQVSVVLRLTDTTVRPPWSNPRTSFTPIPRPPPVTRAFPVQPEHLISHGLSLSDFTHGALPNDDRCLTVATPTPAGCQVVAAG